MSGQTFHFCTIISALPLSTDHSLFLLAVGLANGAAPRITELTDKLFTILIFRLGPNEVLFENEFCKIENESFAGYWLHSSPPTIPIIKLLAKINKLLANPPLPHPSSSW